ncbi:nucleoporin Nup37 [Drosophila pseudoobscura]|uniref:Nucleoporin Nup37 n=1 Tax=Drosophila pseudoobscura pseudoobscura TaxID=46245 RepID=A0A6I8URY9_DROPS|nr:nucleoporin Nup37 [Drosophila pseudoobscura]
MRTVSGPDHTIDLNEQIQCYEICANDFACNLIAVALERRICLIVVGLPEESGEFLWHHLQDLELGDRDGRFVSAITFSPDTSLNSTPNNVTFCAALGTDMKIFRTDVDQYNTFDTLKGHTDYVNDISWVCEGVFLASVSDDFTCRFWSTAAEAENVITFCLSSAGMSIKSHPDDNEKVLVAEKRGIIHLYNVRQNQTVLSVESPKFPLMSADWAQSNRLFVSALAGGDVITWDLNRPFVPADVKQIHEDGGRVVRFSAGSSEAILASIGRPGVTLKVFGAKSTVPLLVAGLKTYAGLAWHQRLPYISAASDRKLLFWKVQMK